MAAAPTPLLPEWMVVGAKLVIVTDHSLNRVVVDRILKRDIVLRSTDRAQTEAMRFRRDQYERNSDVFAVRTGGTWTGRRHELMPIDRPKAKQIRKKLRTSNARSQIITIAEDWQRSKDDELLTKLMVAIADYQKIVGS